MVAGVRPGVTPITVTYCSNFDDVTFWLHENFIFLNYLAKLVDYGVSLSKRQ